MDENKFNTAQLETWHAWKKVYKTIFDRISNDIAVQTGLSEGDFGVLSRLVDLGNGALRQQELADSMQWDKSRLSHHLTRMEKRGLLTRKSLETERGVQVIVTSAGRTSIENARPIHTEAIRKHLLNHLTVEDIELIMKMAERI